MKRHVHRRHVCFVFSRCVASHQVVAVSVGQEGLGGGGGEGVGSVPPQLILGLETCQNSYQMSINLIFDNLFLLNCGSL